MSSLVYLAQEVALIGGVDDDGIVAVRFDRVQYETDRIIHRFCGAQIITYNQSQQCNKSCDNCIDRDKYEFSDVSDISREIITDELLVRQLS